MNKNISRRDFLKGMGVAGLGLAVAPASVLAEGAAYKAGTYTATRYGNISYITVETTFSETAITAIKVVENGETPILFTMVEDQLIPAIIENQAGGVDVVAGATKSSQAIIDAVADCVAQAGGDAEAFLAKQITKIAGADETYDCDVAVVGVGAAGFVASIAAAKAGAKVLVVEKGASVASVNGIKVSGPFAIGTDVLLSREIGSALTVDEVFNHMMEYVHWATNPALVRKCLETSKDAVAMLQSIGYKFQDANFRFETPFKGEKEGFHLILNPVDERVALWQKALDDNGIQVMYKTAATELIMKDGKAAGFMAKRDDGTIITVNAKAVIIASGGYLGNREMQKKYLKTDKLNAAAGGTSLCTGDGINMGLAAGASMEKTFGYCPCEYGGTNAKATRPAKQDKYDQNLAFKFGLYGNLLVDAQGKRFINEGLLCDYPMSHGSEQILHNSPWYGIVDQAYVDAMKTTGLYEYTTAKGATEETWFIGNYFKNRILTTLDADIEEGIREGWVAKADTIEELAKAFDLTDLPKTVETYNSYCEKGVDEQFHANPWYLSPIKTGPFYVVQNEPSAWSTFGGLRIDDNCRVLNDDAKPIGGLYCCGTDAGSLYHSPYYDIAGSCYGLCIDSGFIAGNEAAAESKA